jgi:hypothetical protein
LSHFAGEAFLDVRFFGSGCGPLVFGSAFDRLILGSERLVRFLNMNPVAPTLISEMSDHKAANADKSTRAPFCIFPHCGHS